MMRNAFALALLVASINLMAQTGVGSYPANFYCQEDNISFLGESFFKTNCQQHSADIFKKATPPINIPTVQYYELDHILAGKEFFNSVLNLIRLHNTFNGQHFHWASLSRVTPQTIKRVLSHVNIFSHEFSSDHLTELFNYINSLPLPQIFALTYTDVARGGMAETIYFIIYDPIEETVLIVHRMIYAE